MSRNQVSALVSEDQNLIGARYKSNDTDIPVYDNSWGQVYVHRDSIGISGIAIRKDWTCVEIQTAIGSSWHGVEFAHEAFIDSSLRFVTACNDRDEVLSKWEKYNA